jgi:hypothetical protein
MNTIRDLKTLASPLYSDPIIVHRLRIMHYSKRPNHNMPIIRLFDNCLRKKIDRWYCWRRNKYVTRLGLYYWINQHDENCQECKQTREPEWKGFESSFITMMKANPINGGGLDFARMAAGLGGELSCFGAFLSTIFGGKLNQHKSPGEHPNATATGELPNVNVDPSGHLAPLKLSLRDYNHPDSEGEVLTNSEPGETALVSSFDPADFLATGEMPLESNYLPEPAAEIKPRTDNVNRKQTRIKVSSGRPNGAVRPHSPTVSQSLSKVRLQAQTITQSQRKVQLQPISQSPGKVQMQPATVSQSLSKVRLHSSTVSQSLIMVRLNASKVSHSPGKVRTMFSA